MQNIVYYTPIYIGKQWGKIISRLLSSFGRVGRWLWMAPTGKSVWANPTPLSRCLRVPGLSSKCPPWFRPIVHRKFSYWSRIQSEASISRILNVFYIIIINDIIILYTTRVINQFQIIYRPLLYKFDRKRISCGVIFRLVSAYCIPKKKLVYEVYNLKTKTGQVTFRQQNTPLTYNRMYAFIIFSYIL